MVTHISTQKELHDPVAPNIKPDAINTKTLNTICVSASDQVSIQAQNIGGYKQSTVRGWRWTGVDNNKLYQLSL